MSVEDLKIKGSVREIGIMRDADRFDTFNITIGIVIKNDLKISYEEAEQLSSKYRKEYLGKEVEFLSVNIPCPYCNKILNSQASLKRHISKLHSEKIELINPSKIESQIEKTKKQKPQKKSNGTKKPKKTQKKGEKSNKIKIEKKGSKKPVSIEKTSVTKNTKKVKPLSLEEKNKKSRSPKKEKTIDKENSKQLKLQ
ncbi:C2H2-type zinc finger protein [Candidatus Bathyarchaeota archaeon]|nr:C2H2-type zinc finger protein [Candidatus Bathyarchaeota archaeon]